MWRDNPSDANSPASPSSQGLASSIVITGQVRVYGFTVYSSKNASQFVLLFDASKLPTDTSVPIVAIPVSTQTQASAYYGPMGRLFHQGFVLCNSSTDTTKTLGGVDCFFDVQLDYLI